MGLGSDKDDEKALAEAWLERALARRASALLLAGPTASGKTALALTCAELAKSRGIDVFIVNADSMQVYRELCLITARPGADDLAKAPHYLFGHMAAVARYSVANWLADVAALVDEKPGSLPLIVGGTGLYFSALTEGLAPIPPIDPAVRAAWRAAAANAEPGDLYEALRARDPAAAARLPAGDTQRLVRALEVVDSTGKSLAAWQEAPNAAPLFPLADAEGLVLDPDRALLNARISKRLEAMLAAGACEEALRLLALDLPDDATVLKAIGVRNFAQLARGESSREEALESAAIATRRYAKRQRTWFRQRMREWHWSRF